MVQSLQLQLQKANKTIADVTIKYQQLKHKFRMQKQRLVGLELMKGIRMNPLQLAASVMQSEVLPDSYVQSQVTTPNPCMSFNQNQSRLKKSKTFTSNNTPTSP